MAFAHAQLGEPYVLGGTGPDVWDCSGLMLRSWEQAGITLPRIAADQFRWNGAKHVPAGTEKRGDLMFFVTVGTPLNPGHVGMVWDENAKLMIHAPTAGMTVEIVSYNSTYWQDELIAFHRITAAAAEPATEVAGEDPSTEELAISTP